MTYSGHPPRRTQRASPASTTSSAAKPATIIAKHDLIEVIRSDKDRNPVRDEDARRRQLHLGVLPPIRYGRSQLDHEILTAAQPAGATLGHRAARRPLQTHQLQGRRHRQDLRPHDLRAHPDRRPLPFRRGGRGRQDHRPQGAAICWKSNPAPTARSRKSWARPMPPPPSIYAKAYNCSPSAA